MIFPVFQRISIILLGAKGIVIYRILGYKSDVFIRLKFVY